MTPQEAIEIIKIAIAEVEWNYPMDYAVAFEKAIEALEKQIPKKPKTLYCLGEVSNYSCPNCGEAQGKTIGKKWWNYCPHCQQALDWR
jgi:formamidopyrimidine-DNA glycosylase